MKFRKAVESDIEDIMNIINKAQSYLKGLGIDQWQNNYPNCDVIKKDIDNGDSYVLEKDGKLLGTVAVIFDGEKTYDIIYNGQWLSDGEYATIHRLAVDSNYRGLGISSIILENIKKMCIENNINSIKVDTHSGNLPMQKFLQKHGFIRCGIIYLEDGNERIAFEKMWNNSKIIVK